MLNKESLGNILFALAAAPGGQKELAKQLRVSPQYLSDVLHGRRDFGVKLLTALGYRRVVMYERIK